MGVSYQDFWEFTPNDITPFVKAFRLKLEQNDAMAWQQGLYIRLAVASCLSKKTVYPKKPLGSTPKKQVDPEQGMRQRFLNHMALLNQRFRKEN